MGSAIPKDRTFHRCRRWLEWSFFSGSERYASPLTVERARSSNAKLASCSADGLRGHVILDFRSRIDMRDSQLT